MSQDRLTDIALRLAAARRAGTRIVLPDAPRDFDEAAVVQDKMIAALGARTIGWKVNELPGGMVTFAPILDVGAVANGGTWTVVGSEPAGMELEIAFRMGRDVAPGASRAEIIKAVGAAHVVFELCQSRIADPANVERHVALADAISNHGIVVGPEITGWRAMGFKAVPGRLFVDGQMLKDGQSADPWRALEVLPAALGKLQKKLSAGQIVITGSLIGMNWITGRHDLRGVIDGCGEVTMKLVAAA